METRKCANPKCGKDLPLTDFNVNRNTCKYCDRQVAKKHRKKGLAKRRSVITRHLGKVCVICGEKNKKLMRSHEKYGAPHPKLLDTPLDEIKKNCKSGRFVRVCAKCQDSRITAVCDSIAASFSIVSIDERVSRAQNDKHAAARACLHMGSISICWR